jgi:hypothetical protein
MRRFFAVVPFALSASVFLHAACGGDDTQNVVYQSYDSSLADVSSASDALTPGDSSTDAGFTCGAAGTLPTVNNVWSNASVRKQMLSVSW